MATYVAPGVYGRDVDLSQIVRNQATSIGAIVGQAARGPVNKRVLFTNTRDAVSTLGQPNTVFGYGVHSLLVALEEMSRCYFVRVTRGAFSSALIVNTETATSDTSNVPHGVPQGLEEDYDSFPVSTVETVDTADGTTTTYTATLVNTPVASLTEIHNGSTTIPVSVGTGGAITGTGISAGTINLVTGALSVTFTVAPQSSAVIQARYEYSDIPNASFLIFAENPGVWGNTIKIGVKEVLYDPEAFQIDVYETVEGVDLRRESFVVSRKQKKDGFGGQMYIEEKINERSAFVRVVNNRAVSEDIMPSFTTVPTALTGGADGDAINESNIVQSWQLFKNPAEVDMNILINAGYVSTDTFGVQASLKALAEQRRDCFAILDIPYTETKMFPTTDARDWRVLTQNLSSSFTALYSPWILVYDTFNDIRRMPMPPSGFVAQVFARTDWTRESWYAPAGYNRGIIGSQLLPPVDVTDRYGVPGVPGEIGDLEALYEAPSNINPIIFSPGDGIVVFGQKTQQTKPSALDRINVRRLIIAIERAAKQFLKYKLFEMNNVYTRMDITSALDQFMRDVQARNGVYTFKVVCDGSNNTPQVIDNNQLNVDIYLQPQKAAEFIQLQSIITRTGVDFRVFIRQGGSF
jgi:phage tail sheath protein FI